MHEHKTDLGRALAALHDKAVLYTDLWRYYDGDQPIMYSTAKMREMFKDIDVAFRENWCAVVIDSVMERIHLDRFRFGAEKGLTEEFTQLFSATGMALDESDAHLAALVTGESFVIAWQEEGRELPEVYYNDPRQCVMFYDPDNPRTRAFAAKWWDDAETHKRRVILYYADRIERYVSRTPVYEGAFKAAPDQFEADPELPIVANPWGEIPVFHFRRERRVIKSELANVIDLQNAVNKTLSDMMVVGEFTSFPQRYIIGNLSKDSKFKNGPNEIWVIPSGDSNMGEQPSQVGQFAAGSIDNYLKALDHFSASIAQITRIPKHYFMDVGREVSGQALLAMEAPLVKKAKRYIDRFSDTWQDVARFMARMALNIDVPKSMIEPVFDDPETVQPVTRAEIRKVNVDAGLPLRTVLRDEGWDEEEIEQVSQDLVLQRAADLSFSEAVLQEADRAARERMDGFQRGQQP